MNITIKPAVDVKFSNQYVRFNCFFYIKSLQICSCFSIFACCKRYLIDPEIEETLDVCMAKIVFPKVFAL